MDTSGPGRADPERLMTDANIRFGRGQIAEAAQLCDQALAAAPDMPAAMALRGEICALTGELEAAHDFLTRALSAQPTLTRAQAALARVEPQLERLRKQEQKDLQRLPVAGVLRRALSLRERAYAAMQYLEQQRAAGQIPEQNFQWEYGLQSQAMQRADAKTVQVRQWLQSEIQQAEMAAQAAEQDAAQVEALIQSRRLLPAQGQPQARNARQAAQQLRANAQLARRLGEVNYAAEVGGGVDVDVNDPLGDPIGPPLSQTRAPVRAQQPAVRSVPRSPTGRSATSPILATIGAVLLIAAAFVPYLVDVPESFSMMDYYSGNVDVWGEPNTSAPLWLVPLGLGLTAAVVAWACRAAVRAGVLAILGAPGMLALGVHMILIAVKHGLGHPAMAGNAASELLALAARPDLPSGLIVAGCALLAIGSIVAKSEYDREPGTSSAATWGMGLGWTLGIGLALFALVFGIAVSMSGRLNINKVDLVFHGSGPTATATLTATIRNHSPVAVTIAGSPEGARQLTGSGEPEDLVYFLKVSGSAEGDSRELPLQFAPDRVQIRPGDTGELSAVTMAAQIEPLTSISIVARNVSKSNSATAEWER